MSAFGTKKRGADQAVQLTFPAVFSEAVASEANPYGYYPQRSMRPVELPQGDDLQDKYHEQKRLDANRRVMNAVRDNRASTARFLRSHANYDLPKPLLTQRILANPSNGNQADIYSHRPIDWTVDWSGLQGGVLFTQEAQKWGRQKLRDRIPQLDAIALAKQEFVSGLPTGAMAQKGIPSGVEEFPLTSSVELMASLQSLASSVGEGKITGLTLSDTVKMLRLLFRWASTASEDELQEVMEYVDDIIENLNAIEDEFVEGVAEDAENVKRYSDELLKTMRKVRQYLVSMIGVVNKSPKERQKASANFIKNAGFTSLTRQSAEEKRREWGARLATARRADQRELNRELDSLRNIPIGDYGDFGIIQPKRASVELDQDQREVKADESGASYLGEESSSSSSSSSTRNWRSTESAQLPENLPEAPEAEFEGPARASSSSSSGTMSLEAIQKAVNNRRTNAKDLHDKLAREGLMRSVLPTKFQGRKTTAEEYRNHIRQYFNL